MGEISNAWKRMNYLNLKNIKCLFIEKVDFINNSLYNKLKLKK